MKRNYMDFFDKSTQIYLNQYTILLILIIIKLLLLRNSLINTISKQLIDESTCDDDTLQPALNAVHNMIFDIIAKFQFSGIVFVVLIIKTIRELTIFYIDLFLGTYVCLLNSLVKGTTEFAFDASESVIQAVNTTIIEATKGIEEGLQGLSTLLNDVTTGFDEIKNIFSGGGSSFNANSYEQKINISLGALKDKIAIPGSIMTQIDNARNVSMYELEDMNNQTQNLIKTPFNLIIDRLQDIKLSNATRNNFTIVPINVKDACLKTVDKVKDTQDHLVKFVETTSKYLFLIMVIITVGSIAYAWYMERRQWNRKTNFINEAGIDDEVGFRNQENLYSNFMTYTLVKRMKLNVNHKVVWIISYMSNRLARNILVFGILGLLAAILQLILVNYVQDEIQKQNIDMSVNTNSISTSAYVKLVNDYINITQSDLNEKLFGEIRSTAIKINSTICEFVDDLDSAIVDIFGKTSILASAINTVVYCTIGRKLLKIEQGCTWLYENLQIDIPLISDSIQRDLLQVKVLQPSNVLTKLDMLIVIYVKSIMLELYVALAFLGVWGIQLIIGVILLMARQRIANGKGNSEQVSDGDKKDKAHFQNTRILKISSPRPLSQEQLENYPYALSNPHDFLPHTTSSYYPTPPP
ncbi:Prm1 protein [Candida orthopsilosis Co 90-125]|uniref:Plasma membrane fusion protein PRM1 n=1 Tax=Candida orthopsilosis (strain 90-125) TaxID=1136231 RepID=H8WWW7_CANO9|nr:Prm1 protein [Candida orthopsilosis Co 90-125]CCG21107.1 Prm1 protein [Candida orthopsilosis Co 90-125]